MLFLSIATVEHRLGVDGVDSLSTLSVVCVCMRVHVSVRECTPYVSLWVCDCLFVDEEFQDVVCFVESISVETQNQEWNSETLSHAKPDNEVLTVCWLLSDPQRTLADRYNEQSVCVHDYLCMYLCENTSVTLMRVNKIIWIIIILTQQNIQYMHSIQDHTQLPSFNSSCTWTQEPNYCRWGCVYF